jgi:hypothetical protein
VWWQVIWQDSLLSITFDRPSSTTLFDHKWHNDLFAGTGKPGYTDCVRALCRIGLDAVRERAVSRRSSESELHWMLEVQDKIGKIVEHAPTYLIDLSKCRSSTEQMEYWNFHLHKSFITSETSRPTLKYAHRGGEHRDTMQKLREKCINSLVDTVEAFLGLQNISKYAHQSWAAVHRALSSALLLGILGESSKSERAQKGIQSLIQVIDGMMAEMDPADVAPPLTRAVSALRRLNSPEGMGSLQSMPANFAMSRGSTESQSPSQRVTDDETSPFTLIDTILWGGNQPPGMQLSTANGFI